LRPGFRPRERSGFLIANDRRRPIVARCGVGVHQNPPNPERFLHPLDGE
jgi:hypothetical protein